MYKHKFVKLLNGFCADLFVGNVWSVCILLIDTCACIQIFYKRSLEHWIIMAFYLVLLAIHSWNLELRWYFDNKETENRNEIIVWILNMKPMNHCLNVYNVYERMRPVHPKTEWKKNNHFQIIWQLFWRKTKTY